MKLGIHHISPSFHQFTTVITCYVKDYVRFLRHRINIPDGDEEACTADDSFQHGFLHFRYPAIGQFYSLRCMNTVNEQDWVISGFLFQFFVVFSKGFLLFCAVFMWNASLLFVAEAVEVSPFVHPGKCVPDIPPFINQRDNLLCCVQQIHDQMSDKIYCLCFIKMAPRTAVFRLKFFIAKPVMQMPTSSGFINTLGLCNHAS